jgi:hypothetical protein
MGNNSNNNINNIDNNNDGNSNTNDNSNSGSNNNSSGSDGGGGGGANISNNDKGDNKCLFLFLKKIYKRLGEQNLSIFLFKKIKIFSYTFRKLLFILL